MEVIYTGLHQTPEQIVETVLQEDADAVGLSILSGAHMTLVPRIAALLKDEGAEDVVLVVGGTIPNDDIPGSSGSAWRRSSPGAPARASSTSSRPPYPPEPARRSQADANARLGMRLTRQSMR